MRLDRWITLNAVAPLQRMGLWRPKPGIPILMYHSVSDDPETGVRPYYRLAIPPALFREHMRTLKDQGYRVVTLPQATEALAARPDTRYKLAVITFDDGFRDFLTAASPILAEFGFSATVFLPTAFIHNQRRSFKGRECLTWDEVRDLKRAGIQFGSHTVNHPKLATLSESELEWELFESRRVLEQELSTTINTFAHPYAFPDADADYLERYHKALGKTGYTHAVTTTVGRGTSGLNPWTIRRLPANGADDAALLRAKLNGAYDWLRRPQNTLRRVRSIRRAVPIHRA